MAVWTKPKKITKYVPPPLPQYSPEEACALEKKLRDEIDSWARLQGDSLVARTLHGRLFEKLLPTNPKRKERRS